MANLTVPPSNPDPAKAAIIEARAQHLSQITPEVPSPWGDIPEALKSAYRVRARYDLDWFITHGAMLLPHLETMTDRGCDAVIHALVGMNGDVLVKMAKELAAGGPGDLTPFNHIAHRVIKAALQTTGE